MPSTWYAATCSQADFDAQVALAGPGDTIVLPAGSATWTGVTFPFPLILRGSGKGATIITYNGSYNVITFTGASRITEMGFDLGYGSYGIKAHGANWRVDHCDCQSDYFTDFVNATRVSTGAYNGVIDHNTTRNCRVECGTQLSLGDMHAVWHEASVIGGSGTVFVEYNTIVFDVFGNCIDGDYGSTYVFRFNDVTDSSAEAHSMQAFGFRGHKSSEIYGNIFRQVTRSMNFPWFIRGGTAVIYDNVVIGTWTNPGGFINNVRSAEFRGVCNHANGQLGYDSIGAAGIAASGTHSGGTSATVLTDSGKSWTTDQFSFASVSGTHTGSNGAAGLTDSSKTGSGGFNYFAGGENCITSGYVIRNITDGSWAVVTAWGESTVTGTLQGGTDNDWDTGDSYAIYPGGWVHNITDGSKACIVKNTSTTITVGALTGGSDNTFQNGDSYEVRIGYPARDGPGRGPDLTLETFSGDSSNASLVLASLPWPEQASEPIYYWNNRAGSTSGSILTLGVSGGAFTGAHIQVNRDYFLETPRPGYAPYPSPHPSYAADVNTPPATNPMRSAYSPRHHLTRALVG